MSLVDDDEDYENTSMNSEDDDNIYTELDINNEFRNNIVNCKKKLYKLHVTDVPIENSNSQSNKPLLDYLKSVSILYKIFKDENIINVSSVNWNNQPWNEVPKQIQQIVIDTIQWYINFLKVNKSDLQTLPYKDYIHESLYVHPFVQNEIFE
jgi:hypothetical protein